MLYHHAAVSDVRLAARHDMPPDDDGALLHLAVDGDEPLEGDHFPVVFSHLFHEIAVKEGIIPVLDLDDFGVDIVRERIFDLVVFRPPARIFEDDARPSRSPAHDLVELLFGELVVEAVEDDHIGIRDLVIDELPHVLVVGKEGGRIEEGHHLRDEPAVWHGVEELLKLPHPVVFEDDAVGAVLLNESGKVLAVQPLFVHFFDGKVLHGKAGRIVLLHSLFADKKEGAFSGIEALILHRFLNECRLARLQKAEEQVDGDLFPAPWLTPKRAL